MEACAAAAAAFSCACIRVDSSLCTGHCSHRSTNPTAAPDVLLCAAAAAMSPSSLSLSSLLMGVLLLFTLHSCLYTSAQVTDPCLASCCSSGWLFYGEGNFSKLGVNGSSDCNCFDTQITACPKSYGEAQQKRMQLRKMFGGAAANSVQSSDIALDDHCLSACCSVGHTLWGNGDYARLGACNCAMQIPQLCSAEVEDQ
jgi:hypothetical protein